MELYLVDGMTYETYGKRQRIDADVIVADSDFHERTALKAARFRWHPSKRVWWTDDLERAAQLLDIADMDDDLRDRLQNLGRDRAVALEASRATEADICIPAPDGLAYMPFQRAGIAYALGRRGTLIGDEMGLGKTIQAIGVINADAGIRRVLVVCPASLKLNWRNELERWLVRPLSITVAQGKDLDPNADIVIINYDILKRHLPILEPRQWDVVVVDEAHYVKNSKAARSKHLRSAISGASRTLMLTGTPISNRPVELFNLINLLDPGRWPKFFNYAMRYCNAQETRWGWDFTGASNLPELQHELRSTIMIRRLKRDVLTELPPKRRQILELARNGLDEYVRAEQESTARWAEDADIARLARDAAEDTGDDEAYADAVAQLQSIAASEISEMALLRHDTARAKVPYVIDHVSELLEATDKVVVMAHHRDVIAGLAEGLSVYNPVTLTGQTPQAQRQEAVEQFQGDAETRVFVGSIQAAGVGITLTAASTVVFAELDWVPGNMSQAEDRCHRIGQADSVLVQHVVVDESMDARLAKTLVGKQAVLDAVLDNATSIQPIAAPEPPQEAPQRAPEPPALPDPQVAAIREALGILAALDPDHAAVQNDAGFSAFDGRIGHSLASVPHLSVRQAHLGRRLLKKYHRQIPAGLYATATEVQ